MPEFQRDDRLDLEYGVTLRSVGVGGRTGEVRQGPAAGTPVRDAEPGALPEVLAGDGVPDDAATVLGTAARDAGMRRELSLPVDDLTSPAAPGAPTRGGEEAPHLELEVPAPADDEGQVVLEVDATGVVRWHVPDIAATGGGTDRAGGVQTFRIPIEQVDVDVPGDGQARGVLGFGVKKVLHVLRFPVEKLAARAGELAVGWWERRQRPYGLELVAPDTFSRPIEGPGVPVSRLAELADKPFLLLVHGTFSRGRSAFHGIGADAALLAELCRRYDRRVLVFDHPTLHVDCQANTRWLLERLPSDRPLTFDIVTHSRGGLVARELVGGARAAGRPAPTVRTLVHVATPNAGTVLASKQRWGDLLDVFTNVLALFPDDSVSVAVEGVLEVVKQVATGVLGGLDGLAAMDPEAQSLKVLNSAPAPHATTVHAMTSDFEPAQASLAIRALDLVVDPLFGAANDLVVPTKGVYSAGSYLVDDHFTVPASRVVSHTTFFRDADVRHRLAGWLPSP